MPTAEGRFPALRMDGPAAGKFARRDTPSGRGAGKADQRRGLHAGGYSWGYDEGGIWVDHGCRGLLPSGVLSGREKNRGGESIVALLFRMMAGGIYCEGGTRAADVDLIRQHSEAACQEGYSWGFDDRGNLGGPMDAAAEFCGAGRTSGPQHQGGQGGPAAIALLRFRMTGEGISARWTCGGGVQLVKQRSGGGRARKDIRGGPTSGGFGWTTDAGRDLCGDAAEVKDTVKEHRMDVAL